MNNLLPFAIVSIVSALVFYTIGVWSEKFAGRLKPWHLAFFFLGLACDTTGTALMGEIAGTRAARDFDLHGVTGALAIGLMLLHAAWAVIVLLLKQERVLRQFHKFSLGVWAIWLVPFLSGMAGAMMK